MTAPQSIKDGYEETLPGIYSLVPNEVYHSVDGLSKSNICDINKSVSTYELSKKFNKKSTDAMIKGSALHDLVLLPDVYKDTYLIGPTIGKNTNKWKEFIKENPNKVVINEREEYDIKEMRSSLLKNPTINKILSSKTILREVSIWERDTSSNLLLKVRPDIIVDGIIYDIKTTISPHIRGFLQTVWKYKYHVQSSYYQYVCSLNGMSITNFKFIVVGSKPPYLTAIYDINDDMLQEGEDIYRNALTTYSNYLLSDDRWDGLSYGRETVTL